MSHLTREQRYTISVMLKAGYKQKDIAEDSTYKCNYAETAL